MPPLRWTALASLALLALLLAGCGGSDPHQPTYKTIDIKARAFNPATVEVLQGDSVQFLNKDTSTHAVRLDSGERETGKIVPGASAAISLPTAGSHRYHCTIHPTMAGTIVVKEP